VNSHPFILLVVAEEVLDGRLDTGALDTPNERSGTKTGEVRVLADGLEAAAAERVALHVDGRSQNHMRALGDGLVAHCAAGFLEQLLVEGGAKSCSAGEAGGWDTPEELCSSDTIGAICEAKRGNSMVWKALCVPKVNT
jgi:hypothetical protein